ncbi:hypothetical protein DLE60_16655 [Micromonospora globispora]|uniref:Uncharacterized protein n=1 Tax=Micromonospora globispora TaxID=1450148 RepID=A0A317JZP4_9ACTN|nr:hypothetical protein [Micromonospora globispora]PWU46267.1 hypothetical protein DLJ46_18655 [Micromonospora globispora]PWU59410.1 hypothetical protein DLE60_16655 [Micromonospora globispora]RQW93041.1 hypothetical protein DKL51_18000 [Micromonospora globispora]
MVSAGRSHSLQGQHAQGGLGDHEASSSDARERHSMTTARTRMVTGILLLILLLLVVLGVFGWVLWEFSQSMDFD